jgi:multiple sugar transport system ATP-binding protein
VTAERDVAFVFQQYSLYPHLTVYDNLAFPLRSPARRMNEQAIRRALRDIIHIARQVAGR